jgi:hypothetical protein
MTSARGSWAGVTLGALVALLAGCSEDATSGSGAGGASTGATGSAAAAGSGGSGSGGAAGTQSGGAGGEGLQAGKVAVFVAQGMVGRTTISCDDGHSWVGNRAWDTEDNPHLCGSTNIQCDTEGSSCSQKWYDGTCSTHTPCDCGHSPGFSKGLAFDGEQFVATWGWGWPGSVARSRNGVDWEVTLDENQFGGIAYGAGRFVLAARDNFWSSDGLTWNPGATAEFSGPNEPVIWSVRRFAYADYDTGRFVAIASGNVDRDVLVSSDGGETWWRPDALPEGCGAGVSTYGGIVYGNGTIAMIGDGSSCSSIDGGQTWTLSTFTDDLVVANPIFTGSEFWAWSHYDHVLYRSNDAKTWTSTSMATPTSLAAVARNPETGTLVAVTSMWAGYDAQRFLRSDDGLTWDELPEGSFVKSHPIFHIELGYAEPSAACP